jgi:hypothetical protein
MAITKVTYYLVNNKYTGIIREMDSGSVSVGIDFEDTRRSTIFEDCCILTLGHFDNGEGRTEYDVKEITFMEWLGLRGHKEALGSPVSMLTHGT